MNIVLCQKCCFKFTTFVVTIDWFIMRDVYKSRQRAHFTRYSARFRWLLQLTAQDNHATKETKLFGCNTWYKFKKWLLFLFQITQLQNVMFETVFLTKSWYGSRKVCKSPLMPAILDFQIQMLVCGEDWERGDFCHDIQSMCKCCL